MPNLNARIIEKEIMVGIDSDAGGNSLTVDLNGASKMSCQAIYTVDSPTGASVTFQASNDGSNWTNIQSATSISANGSTFLEQPNVAYRYFRAVKAISSGDVTLSCLVLVIGDAE